MKRLLASLVLLCSLAVPFAAWGATIPDQVGDIYVQDFAGVLSSNTKAKLIARGKQVHDSTTAQVVAMTVSSLDGATIEEYANEAFRKYGIGDKDKNNGVLLLISIKERKIRIEVGYGLEGAIPDGKSGRIRDNVIEYLKKGDFDGGVAAGYEALATEAAKEYAGNPAQKKSSKSPISIFFMIPFFFIVFFIILLAIVKRRIGRHRRHRGHGFDDDFFTGFGAGWLGGSSWGGGDSSSDSSWSSGDSFGDGGSSGGGGSSGDF